ncbi:MAG: HupE/UreJ family protein [Pseudomonadota bacterium]
MNSCTFLDLDLRKPSAPDSLGKQPNGYWIGPSFSWYWLSFCALVIGVLAPAAALAHGVAEGDANFLQNQSGFHFWAYFYLGAKHMVTGYDHLLFLAGVIFFLYRLSDIAMYVTLFAVGHSLTLVAGVWFDIPANAYLVDAVIGFSVVYKAFENLGGFKHLGMSVDTRWMVWVFGLFHGFGLATKLQELSLSEEGLFGNLIAFNVGVEAGQLAALFAIIAFMNLWRFTGRFETQAATTNMLLMAAGFTLVGYQLTGYAVS